MRGFLPRSRGGAFLGIAALLVALPVWTLPVGVLGMHGFVAYLSISSAYFSLPAMVFGGAFARREFGMVPASGWGYLLAALFYAALALPLSVLVPLRKP